MRTKSLVVFPLAALLLAALACNLPGGGAATPTATPVPVSTEAVSSLEETLDAAAQQMEESGEVTVVVTEAQLTSLVAFEVQKQQEPVMRNPQVLLRDGQIHLIGEVTQSGITAPLEMKVNVTVGENGMPDYEIASAQLGPLPLPQALLDQFSAQLDDAFNSQLGPEAEKMYIETITIADGLMTVKGRER